MSKNKEKGFMATVNAGRNADSPLHYVRIESMGVKGLESVWLGNFDIYCDEKWRMRNAQMVYITVRNNFAADTRGLAQFLDKVYREDAPVTMALHALEKMGATVRLMRRLPGQQWVDESPNWDAWLAEELKPVLKKKRLAVAA